MKKLTRNEYLSIDAISTFNRAHRTSFFAWAEFYGKILVNNADEDYKYYEKWFELHNTPLMKVLREVV